MPYVKVNYPGVMIHAATHASQQYAVEISLGYAARCYLSEDQARHLIERLQDAITSYEIARKARQQPDDLSAMCQMMPCRECNHTGWAIDPYGNRSSCLTCDCGDRVKNDEKEETK